MRSVTSAWQAHMPRYVDVEFQTDWLQISTTNTNGAMQQMTGILLKGVTSSHLNPPVHSPAESDHSSQQIESPFCASKNDCAPLEPWH
eukprot:6202378-Pleurochrysis_carterae.AAC.3